MQEQFKETYIKGNFKITVVRPVLDDAERKRRMNTIYKATESLLKEV